MSFPQPYSSQDEIETSAPVNRKNRPGYVAILKHLALFVVTFVCVTYVGIFWTGQTANAESYLEMWPQGALFAVLLLGFLATHEFGHYFAAVYHNVKVTLPYFIPLPAGIGTLGAVIKIEEKIRDTVKLFDIGIAGPIAGFIVSLVILLYGFSTLPEPSFIENFAGHEEIVAHVQDTGSYPDTPPEVPESEVNATIILGETLLYTFLAGFFDNVPPMYEMYHFPFLFAGWLGLFFTALNLTPIGQLDGGHILYALVGYRKHQWTARIGLGLITTLAGLEAIPFLFLNISDWLPGYGYSAFVLWALVLFAILRKGYHNDHLWIAPVWAVSLIISSATIYFTGSLDQAGSLIWVVWSLFLVFFVKVEHPPVTYEQPLTKGRRILGWASMAVFVLCISPTPIYFLN
ncbi:site-2 protease family protein [Rhodohalobacter mucosus]|uniref:Site-2 protease family protein n=1 Tax=Rhodohalobacter mucosus TaxID=2079485 RepID=A0A316U026_9BACT|nr:site-2 protease family protein [Rhodohalobacter mucosus]PWN05926.1 site-2 protease family protein [Rhodohalobacter mucosus]